jgi:hypothetical protein
MFQSKPLGLIGRAAMFALYMLVNPGFTQNDTCCITPIQDSLVSALSGLAEFSRVTVKPGATCDTFAVSWAALDTNMGHYMLCCIKQYKRAGNNVEWIDSTSGVRTSGTMAGWCQTSLEKGSLTPLRTLDLTAAPNPFQSQVRIQFENNPDKAVLQVFDVRGAKIHEEMIKGNSGVVWKPANQVQGIYFARVKYQNRVYLHTLICLK